jgi:hypothetical protein
MADRSEQFNMRIGTIALAWINARAIHHGVKRADVGRAMLSVATRHPDEVEKLLNGLTAVEPTKPTRV